MDNLVTALVMFLLGIPASYIVGSLLLEEKESHEGPFKLKNVLIYFPDTNHTQRGTLFDSIRKLFGVYHVTRTQMGESIWTVDADRAEYFSCPFCLSFWASIPFTILGALTTGLPVLWAVVALFGMATLSRCFYRFMTGD